MKTRFALLLVAGFIFLTSFVTSKGAKAPMLHNRVKKQAMTVATSKVSWHYVGYFATDGYGNIDVLVDNDDPSLIVRVRLHGTTTVYEATSASTYDPDLSVYPHGVAVWCESADSLFYFPPAINVPLSF